MNVYPLDLFVVMVFVYKGVSQMVEELLQFSLS